MNGLSSLIWLPDIFCCVPLQVCSIPEQNRQLEQQHTYAAADEQREPGVEPSCPFCCQSDCGQPDPSQAK